MKLVLNLDQSPSALPSGFVNDVDYVETYFDSLFTNNITVTINVGYGEIDGQSLASDDLGESEQVNINAVSYAAVRNALIAEGAPGASTLPTTSPQPGTMYMASSEEKALGLMSNNNSFDGYVGFSDSLPFSYALNQTPASNSYYFIGVLEHEVTEVMGRVSYLDGGGYAAIDLYRYSSPGRIDTTTGGSGSTAYFSTNGGVTNLGSWNNELSNGDLADWYPSGPAAGGHDSFNDYSYPGVVNVLSQNDTTLMSALGWATTTTVTPANQSVAYNQSVPLSSVFSVSGAGITDYQVWFSWPEGGDPADGTVTDNGTPIADDQWVDIGSSLSGVSFVGAGTPGTDHLWLKAYNGQWSEAQAVLTDEGLAAPVVTPIDQHVAYNQSVPLSSIFSVSGAGITDYQVWFSWPEGGDPADGTVTDNGTPIADDQWVDIGSSLSGVSFVGAGTPGTDHLWLKAYNGQWSEGQAVLTDQGLAAPVVTPIDQHVAYNQSVPLSAIFSVSGAGITDYQVWFSWPEGGDPADGTVTDNGTPIADDQWVDIGSSLSGVSFVGAGTPGTDHLWLKAYNGQWSEGQVALADTGLVQSQLILDPDAAGIPQLGQSNGGVPAVPETNTFIYTGEINQTFLDTTSLYADTVVGFGLSEGDRIHLTTDTIKDAVADSALVNNGHDTLITLNDSSTILLKGITSIDSHFFS